MLACGDGWLGAARSGLNTPQRAMEWRGACMGDGFAVEAGAQRKSNRGGGQGGGLCLQRRYPGMHSYAVCGSRIAVCGVWQVTNKAIA